MTVSTGTTPIPVDVELLIISYLRALADVKAMFGDPADVASSYPPGLATQPRSIEHPVARVSQVGESDVARGYLLRTRQQVEVIGQDKAAAAAGIGLLQARLFDAPNVDHAAGVVTDVRLDIGRTWSPDPVTDAPRYLAVFAVYAHA